MDDRALEGVRNTPSQKVIVAERHASGEGSSQKIATEGDCVENGVCITPLQEVVVAGRLADDGSRADLSVEGTAVGGRAEREDVSYISSREDAVAGRRARGKVDSNLVEEVVPEGRNNLDERVFKRLFKT